MTNSTYTPDTVYVAKLDGKTNEIGFFNERPTWDEEAKQFDIQPFKTGIGTSSMAVGHVARINRNSMRMFTR